MRYVDRRQYSKYARNVRAFSGVHTAIITVVCTPIAKCVRCPGDDATFKRSRIVHAQYKITRNEHTHLANHRCSAQSSMAAHARRDRIVSTAWMLFFVRHTHTHVHTDHVSAHTSGGLLKNQSGQMSNTRCPRERCARDIAMSSDNNH